MKKVIDYGDMFDDTLLFAKCVPDFARVAWAVVNKEGHSDQLIEEISHKPKSVLQEPYISYRDWFHILYAGKRLVGQQFAFLIAEPLSMHTIGPISTAVQYAPNLREAFALIEEWAQTMEPINIYIKARRKRGDWVISGEYPLSGWVRSMFTISAGKLAMEVIKTCTMGAVNPSVIFNCEPPTDASSSLIKSIFPQGIDYDFAQKGAWRIEVSHEAMHKPLPLADATRYAAALRYLDEAQRPFKERGITTTNLVEAIQYSTRNILSATQVADRLDVTRKVYECRLRAEATSHKEIADRMCYMRYLEMKPYLTKSEITRRLGFVDSRAIDRLLAKYDGDLSTTEPDSD